MKVKKCKKCKEELDTCCDGELRCTSCNPCLCCSDDDGSRPGDTKADYARRDGYTAWWDAKSKESNPHEPDTDEYEAWNEGWDDAQPR
jgi:hypothetical protein